MKPRKKKNQVYGERVWIEGPWGTKGYAFTVSKSKHGLFLGVAEVGRQKEQVVVYDGGLDQWMRELGKAAAFVKGARLERISVEVKRGGVEEVGGGKSGGVREGGTEEADDLPEG